MGKGSHCTAVLLSVFIMLQVGASVYPTPSSPSPVPRPPLIALRRPVFVASHHRLQATCRALPEAAGCVGNRRAITHVRAFREREELGAGRGGRRRIVPEVVMDG
jgi:hypothetical protein